MEIVAPFPGSLPDDLAKACKVDRYSDRVFSEYQAAGSPAVSAEPVVDAIF